jgi:hypothetical protein
MSKAVMANFVSVIALATLAAGCGQSARDTRDGQATFDYLKAQAQIMEQGRRNLQSNDFPKPPTAPIFTKFTKLRDRLSQTKEYQESLTEYLTNLIQITTESEKVLNNLENQLGALNSAHVAPKAITYATLQEQVIGDAVQVAIKFRELTTRAQDDMHRPHERNVMLPHLLLADLALLSGIGTPVAIHELGKGMSAQARANSEKAQENEAELLRLDDLVSALQDAKTKLENHKSDLLTERNQLLTMLGAQYPQHSWTSLWPAPVQTNKSDLAH